MVATDSLPNDDRLNPVEQPPIQGAYIVLSGPGTGKTTLLTQRVLHIIQATQEERSKILALTFTNRAAAEMRTRLRGYGDQFSSRLFVGTFHSFATHVLRSHGDAIGLDTDFVIFDQADQRSVLKDLQNDGDLGEEPEPQHLEGRREEHDPLDAQAGRYVQGVPVAEGSDRVEHPCQGKETDDGPGEVEGVFGGREEQYASQQSQGKGA